MHQPEASEHHKPHHYIGLDTFRALAIIFVLLRHSWELFGTNFTGPTLKAVFRNGWIGVDMFFVLSGFLIATQLIQQVSKTGTVPFKLFYLKRAFRILPSFYTVLAVYYFFPAIREKPELDAPWRFMTFIMNYGRRGDAYSQSWSLCIEEHFYLVLPALLYAAHRWRKILRPTPIIISILVASILMRSYLWATGADFFLNAYRKTHNHLDGLTVGVALALIREKAPELWTRLTTAPLLILLLSFSISGYGMYLYHNLDQVHAYTLTFTLTAIGFGGILIAAMTPNFWLATKALPGTTYLANLAFNMYLTHKLMMKATMTILADYVNQPIATSLLATALIVLCAMLMHHLVERHFLALRNKIVTSQ
jgi:peptidoglycan/LPS O-acetylase OafA/YrhL